MLALFIMFIFHAGLFTRASKATPAAEDSRGKQLMKKIAAKDRKAFEAFYYLYAERIGAYLTKMLQRHDWVDEAVNDVMLTVWQSAERFDPERGKLTTWLFGIAHNKGLKFLERSSRRKEVSLAENADEFIDDDMTESTAVGPEEQATTSPERQLMGWELGQALGWALSKLSDEHRCVIELCFNNGCSYQEIAEIMQCPENTVKTRMFHARKRLAEHLQRKGFNPAEFEWVQENARSNQAKRA